MKKILYFLPISILLIFSSCNKNNRVSKQINGEWNIDIYSIKQESNGEVTYEESFYNFGTFLFNSDNSMGVLDTETNSFNITNYFLSYDGTLLNIKFDSSGEYVKYVITDYSKKTLMTITNESTIQGVKYTSVYVLSKK
jgi:hypothetical protein